MAKSEIDPFDAAMAEVDPAKAVDPNEAYGREQEEQYNRLKRVAGKTAKQISTPKAFHEIGGALLAIVGVIIAVVAGGMYDPQGARVGTAPGSAGLFMAIGIIAGCLGALWFAFGRFMRSIKS